MAFLPLIFSTVVGGVWLFLVFLYLLLVSMDEKKMEAEVARLVS